MDKRWLFIALLFLSFYAQAGIIFIHNNTPRSLLIVYQICYDVDNCGSRNQLTLAPHKQVALDITPNTYLSILSAVSDGPDIDAWKGNWSAGFRVGRCAAQPTSINSTVGNKITLENLGGSPELICIMSTTSG